METSRKMFFIVWAFTFLAIGTAAAIPPSPVFYKTQNSDEWVRQTLHIQRKYTRVLVVDGSGTQAKNVRVAALELNQRRTDGQKFATLYPVSAVYKSIQEAA